MNRKLTILALGLVFAGTVGCSTTPDTQSEPASEPMTEMASEPMPEESPYAMEEPAAEPEAYTPTPSSSSLGAASSGRGH